MFKRIADLNVHYEVQGEGTPLVLLHGGGSRAQTFEEIEVPKNSPLGFFIAFFAVTGGFGMIWHIFWLGALSLAAIIALIAVLSWDADDEYVLSAANVKAMQANT